MLAEILRSVADVLLADTARGRMARTLLRGFIVGDDVQNVLPDQRVRDLPLVAEGRFAGANTARTCPGKDKRLAGYRGGDPGTPQRTRCDAASPGAASRRRQDAG